MANVNMGTQNVGYPMMGNDIQRFNQQPQQMQMQYPYNNLLTNSPYENYMGGRIPNQQVLSNQFLKCRPVSSKDEARAFQIDLDGSLWVFTDVGNEKIYTKQINNDGTATFKTYTFIEDENPYSSSNEYVTKEEFNKVVQTLMAAMQPTNQQELVPAQSNNGNNDKTNLISF